MSHRVTKERKGRGAAFASGPRCSRGNSDSPASSEPATAPARVRGLGWATAVIQAASEC
jgi:hypothetical protein